MINGYKDIEYTIIRTMNPADMTREELINEVTRVRNLIADFVKIWDEMKIRQDDDYTFLKKYSL